MKAIFTDKNSFRLEMDIPFNLAPPFRYIFPLPPDNIFIDNKKIEGSKEFPPYKYKTFRLKEIISVAIYEEI